MRILQCQLSCHHLDEENNNCSNNSPNSFHGSGYSSSSSSSSSSSLMSQKSFQSLPSLSSSTSSSSSMHHQCISTLKGHTSYVFSLILHGKHLYSGSSNGEIKVWPRELPTHHPQNINNNNNNNTPPVTILVKGEQFFWNGGSNNNSNNNIVCSITNYGAVKSLVALGDKLFSAHQDHKIRVWKIDNSSSNKKGGQKRYECLATLPTMSDRLLKVLSTKNYVKVRRHKSCTWVHHVDTVSSLATSADGAHMYSASWDRSFKVWRTADFKCLESVPEAHDDAINAVVVGAKDGFVYTGSADKTIKIWKKNIMKKQHSLVATLQKHKSGVNALALSTDESLLYSGACDRSILVWNIHNNNNNNNNHNNNNNNMEVVGVIRGHSKAILCLAVVSDLLFSGSADNTVRVWRKLKTENSCLGGYKYSCLGVLSGHLKPVKCLTAIIDPNTATATATATGTDYLVYSGSLDSDIKVWKIWVPFE